MLGAGDGRCYVVFGRFKIVDDDTEDADTEDADTESKAESDNAAAERRSGDDSASSTESEYYEDADYGPPALALIAERLKSGLSALPDDDDSDSSESDEDLLVKQTTVENKSDEVAKIASDEELGSGRSEEAGSSGQDDDDSRQSSDSSDSRQNSASDDESTSIDTGEITTEDKPPNEPRPSDGTLDATSTDDKPTISHTIADSDHSVCDVTLFTISAHEEEYDPVEVFGSSDIDDQMRDDHLDDNDSKANDDAERSSGSPSEQPQRHHENATTVEICSVVVEQMQHQAHVSYLMLEDAVEKTDAKPDCGRSESDKLLFGDSTRTAELDQDEVFGSSDSDNNSALADEAVKPDVNINTAETAQNSEHCHAVLMLSPTSKGGKAAESSTDLHTPLTLIPQDKTQQLASLMALHGTNYAENIKETAVKEREHRCKTCPALLPPPWPDVIGNRQCACCEYVYPPNKFDWARHRCKLCSSYVIWKCNSCGHSFPKEAFSKAQRSRKSGSRCKECVQGSRFSKVSSTIVYSDTDPNGYTSMSDMELSRRLAQLLDATQSLKRKRREGRLSTLATAEIEKLNALSSELVRRTTEILARNKQRQQSKKVKHIKVQHLIG